MPYCAIILQSLQSGEKKPYEFSHHWRRRFFRFGDCQSFVARGASGGYTQYWLEAIDECNKKLAPLAKNAHEKETCGCEIIIQNGRTKYSQAEFLRRVSLDLTGIVPRISETRAFLQDPAPDKRRRLIDRLLVSPRYATHRANQWRDILLPGGLEAEQQAAVVGVQNWLREQFAEEAGA